MSIKDLYFKDDNDGGGGDDDDDDNNNNNNKCTKIGRNKPGRQRNHTVESTSSN